MQHQIDHLTKFYRLRSRDGVPFSKEIGSEFNVPKFPIEKAEMKTHMFDMMNNADMDMVDGDAAMVHESEDMSQTRQFDDRDLSAMRLMDQKMLESLPDANYSTEPVKAKGTVPWYHKITISDEEEATLALEEVEDKSTALMTAIRLRKRYMKLSHQDFFRTTDRYLSLVESGTTSLDHIRVNSEFQIQQDTSCLNGDSAKWNPDHPYDAPSTKGSCYKVDHVPGRLNWHLEFKDGIMQVLDEVDSVRHCSPITFSEFLRDYHAICTFVSDGPLKSFSFRRLNFLEYRFRMHTLLNEWQESGEQKSVPHRDFYNIRKVDTHIHGSSSMNQKHLLRFIKKSLKSYPNEEVLKDRVTGKILTLSEVFDSLGLTPYDLTIDKLDVHCDRHTFHRFDKFNAKYNPVGQSQLREVFLKTDNYCKGKFFAEVVKEVIADLEESKYQSAELRLSIYGRSYDEWDNLATWAVNHDVYSDNVSWMIQFPRIYDIFRSKNLVQNFQQIIDNTFRPLFEVSLDPSSHPQLHRFLHFVSGFDSVDDESKPEQYAIDKNSPTPDQWTSTENPPYCYYLFYTYANMACLNELRSARGLRTFKFRPHCGEAGSIQHLVAGFLLAESINHGLLLRKAPVLQYLYYLCQVGLAMSPLSNNSLFLDYQRNPLHQFLSHGLHVSLSTDDPLQFHFTKEPLMEEYSIAAQVWKLTPTDMCELARNSVLMSGFPENTKSHWLGKQFREEGIQGNDITRSNVPNIRLAYRFEALVCELNLLLKMSLKQRKLKADTAKNAVAN